MEDRLGQESTGYGKYKEVPFFFITINNTWRYYSSRSLYGCFSSREIREGKAPTSNETIILAPKELVLWSDP